MMRSTKLEHTMGVAMTRLLLYHFVGFAHNGAMTNVDGRSGSAAGAQWFSAVAAPCSFCESAMETIILNANAVQAP